MFADTFNLNVILLEAMKMTSKKFKLQFVISEEDFYRFEEIRKKKFSSTSKQHLLNTMFQIWMHKVATYGE